MCQRARSANSDWKVVRARGVELPLRLAAETIAKPPPLRNTPPVKSDPRTPPEFASLPKWLFAPGLPPQRKSRGHIIHCHYPRFVMAVDAEEGSGMPLWIDKPPAAAAASGEHTALALEATDQFKAFLNRT